MKIFFSICLIIKFRGTSTIRKTRSATKTRSRVLHRTHDDIRVALVQVIIIVIIILVIICDVIKRIVIIISTVIVVVIIRWVVLKDFASKHKIERIEHKQSQEEEKRSTVFRVIVEENNRREYRVEIG